MRKHLFVNAKGYTVDQAIMNMHETLEKLEADPNAPKGWDIYSVNFVNSFEISKRNNLDISPNNNQPTMIYNCCVVLMEQSEHNTRMETMLGEIHQMFEWAKKFTADNNGRADELGKQIRDFMQPSDQPTPSEMEILKRMGQQMCEHKNLDPAKHSKHYRNPGQWYRICMDCGAEVWSGITDEHPAPGAGMKAVPRDLGKADQQDGE
jgi:hypothetical protein